MFLPRYVVSSRKIIHPFQHHPQRPISGTSQPQLCTPCNAAVSWVGASRSTLQFEGGYPGGDYWADCVVITCVHIFIFSNLTNASLIVTHHLYLPSPQYSINILLQGPQVHYVPQETLASLQLMLPLPLSLLLALLPSPFIVVSFHCIDTTDELTWALA